MFDFGNANEEQKKAIITTEGPVLIIAGPGTGKTYTIVKRIAYLVFEKAVEPSEIMVVTFTEKAAKELLTRISDEFLTIDEACKININEMYTSGNMLSVTDLRVEAFFKQIDIIHPYKVGMDSCNVPGAIRFCKSIMPEALDTCEGGRYSCYIGADMVMVPCSFDQQKRYEVQLNGNMSIEDAWNSEAFEKFRDKMRGACPRCSKKALCMGGCPLMLEIVFCDSKERYIAEE